MIIETRFLYNSDRYLYNLISTSCNIANIISHYMRFNCISYNDMLSRTGFSDKKLSSILNGMYDLDLKSISILENTLKIKLIEISNIDEKRNSDII